MTDAIEPQQVPTPPSDSEQLELKLPDESDALKDLGLWAGVLVLLTLITWWPATTGEFIWRDDTTAANRDLLAPSGLTQSWFGRWQSPRTFSQPVYQPVNDTAYWMEYRLGGRSASGPPVPTAFHVAGLVFEAGSAILLWLILRELRVPGRWLIAALFAMHPIHAEAVSWISEQSMVLCSLLILASIYCYLMFVKSRERDLVDRASGGAGVDPAQTWGLCGGGIIFSLLSMLSHPVGLIVPIVIFLLLWWKRRNLAMDRLLLVPPLIVGLALWFSNFDLHRTTGETILLKSPLMSQTAQFGLGLFHSLVASLVPFRLSILYTQDPSAVTSLLAQGFVLATFLAVLAALFLKRRGLFVAVTIFALSVFFSLNWFDASRVSFLTDNTAYLAITPWVVVIVFAMTRLRLPGPHPQTVVGVSAGVLLYFGVIGWARSYAFESSMALWTDVLKKNPASVLAQASLAEQLRLAAVEDQEDKDSVKQDLDGAINHAQQALKLDPTNGPAQRTWANALVAQGDVAAALLHYDLAVKADPSNPTLRTEYASALIALGRFKSALPQANEVLALDVKSGTAHRLLGEAYEGLGDNERAIYEQQAALDLSSSDVLARQKLAELQVKTGKLKDAIASYSMILASDQTQMSRPEIWRAIARIKDRQGQYEYAAQYLQQAAELNPDDEDLKKEFDAEVIKRDKAAATRPATTQGR